MKYSGAILAQSAELLVRWVTLQAISEAREGPQSYLDLFLRAGQVSDRIFAGFCLIVRRWIT